MVDFTALSLVEKRALLKALKADIKATAEAARVAKAHAKAEKAARVALKRQASIEKARLKLQKLMDKQNPVGAKALKANRKPGPVTTVTA